MKDTPLRRRLKARSGVALGFGPSTVAGTMTIEARHEDHGLPLAIMWWRWSGNSTLEIMSMYTVDWARKCGLQGWLFEELLRATGAGRVVTASDTRHSRTWLAARGFARNADRDLELVVRNNLPPLRGVGRSETKTTKQKGKTG